MFEQDYFMKLIHEIIRTALKFLFHIEQKLDQPFEIEEEAIGEKYNDLIELVKQGKINQAENRLYEILNPEDANGFVLALLFYDYINSLDIDCLEQSGFSRIEITEGLLKASQMYGHKEFMKTILMI